VDAHGAPEVLPGCPSTSPLEHATMLERWLLISCLAWCGAAAAEEAPTFLYVVEPSSVDLIPKDPARSVQVSPTEVTIDNSCGEFRARFHVIKTIIGPTEHSLRVTGSIGEWCDLPFSASLNPVALWVRRSGKSLELVDALPAHEVRPSEFAIVPVTETACWDTSAKPVWTVIPNPIPLGTPGTQSANFVSLLRQAEALLEEDGIVYARKAVLLNDEFRAACSNNRWRGP